MKVPLHSINEAEIQAEFYHQCRLAGIHLRLEILLQVGRLDCLIFSDAEKTNAFAIVECKRSKPDHNSKQHQRYLALGLPFLWLASMDQIPATISALQQLLSSSPSLKTLSDLGRIPNPHLRTGLTPRRFTNLIHN